MPKQKAIYCAIVFGDLVQDADGGGYSVDPQGKRDFLITDPRVLNMLRDQFTAEFIMKAEEAFEALQTDIEKGGLQF